MVKSVAVQAGQNVGVGAPILVLDTEGKAGAAPAPAAPAPAPAPAPAATAPAPSSSVPSSSSSSSSSSGKRVPSLRFRYGARDAINAQLGLDNNKSGSVAIKTAQQQQQQQSPAKAPAAAAAPAGSWAEQMAKAFPSKAPGGRTYLDLPPMFGRPRISDAEARAIESGGAY